MAELILFKRLSRPGYKGDLESYKAGGGYQAWPKVLKKMKPDQVTEEVKKSGIRGRGGAGFPAGVKWGFIPKDHPGPKYLCCNADEGEPGTFKDRQLMEEDPHMLIEGMAISGYAIGAHTAYIYIRGEFVKGWRVLDKALEEAYAAGFLGENILGSGFNLDIYTHRGAGAYICGEETALLDSLEGKKGQPRLKPPFPAVAGLYGKPTIINNVETLCNVPWIIMNGGEAYAKIGTEKSTGTRVFCLSGHVNKPGNYELPMGITLRELIFEHGGGIPKGRKVKAIIPGGSSVPALTEQHLDVKLDFESVAAAGSMLGSGGVIVIDDTTCMVKAAKILAHFYAHESCGQCTQCREGTAWVYKMLRRIEAGQGRNEDLDMILDLCDNMKAKTICPLSDACAMPVESYINLFRAEFEEHIEKQKCPFKS
jgi:NADH-quinone oxidoreductase subunit F